MAQGGFHTVDIFVAPSELVIYLVNDHNGKFPEVKIQIVLYALDLAYTKEAEIHIKSLFMEFDDSFCNVMVCPELKVGLAVHNYRFRFKSYI